MWRLFKEVFKSLSKNKIMVIGLSILVFLTSGIFTILTSIRSSIVGRFEDYKNVSKLHDITVDLNIPTQGSAYNDGYFVNGQTNEDLKQISNDAKYTPIVYSIDNAKSFNNINSTVIKDYAPVVENILDLSDAPYYIALDNFKNIVHETNNLYVKKDDLKNLYALYLANQNSSAQNNNIVFNLNSTKPSLKVNYDHYLNLYEQTSEGYKLKQNSLTASINDIYTFDQKYKLGDLFTISKAENEIYATQVSSLFLNINTKQITANYFEGITWVQNGLGIQINTNKVMKSLNFAPIQNNDYVYKFNGDLETFKDILNINDEQTLLDENIEFKDSILLNHFIDQDITIKNNVLINLKQDQEVELPWNWIIQEARTTQFLRFNYYTTYFGEFANKWEGSYKTTMEVLGDLNDANRNAQWDQFESFSYWQKQKSTSITPYNEDGTLNFSKTNTKNLLLPLNSDHNFLEINNIKLFTDDPRTIPTKNAYKIAVENSQTINEIETKSNKFLNNASLSTILLNVNNANILAEKTGLIKNNSAEVTRNTIIQKISKLVDYDNIGLRETITVDAINSSNAKQNVFHFINTGDEENRIGGIQINVGKLYEEHYFATELNNFGENGNDVFKSAQIPPYVASLIIKSISRNFYPDPEYIQPVYRFANVFDNKAKSEFRNLTNTKIIVLNNYVSNESKIPNYEDLNLGLVFINNKFKLVQRDIVDNKYTTPESWSVVYPDGMDAEGMDTGLVEKYIQKHKLTIATTYLKQDGFGWVKNDQSFENLFYVPILFLSPRNQLIYEIMNTGKSDYLVEQIEKYLLNYDLVRDHFITTDQVLELSKVLKNALNQNNFGSVFSSGKMNTATLPKIVFDILYEASHSTSGDLIKQILFQILQQAKVQIKSYGNLDEQKQGLVKEINNIYELLKQFTQIDINEFLPANLLAYSSKDPTIVLEALSYIISSIDLKKFSAQARHFYENEADKIIINDQNKQKYKRYLSSGDILLWVFNSIDQNHLKVGLNQFINNLDMNKAISLESEDSILYFVLNKLNPSLIEAFKPIISKLNATPDQPFSNVQKGLLNIINTIDFNILASELSKSQKQEFVDYKVNSFDTDKNKYVENTYYAVVSSINPKEGILAFLKSIFSAPGSNRAFKLNLIEMFNLSSATQTISSGSETIYLPASDDEKISFFDFIKFFEVGLKSTNGDLYWNKALYNQLQELLNVIKNSTNYSFNQLDYKYVELIKKYNLFNETNSKEEAIKIINGSLNFLSQTFGGNRLVENINDKTGADLLNDLRKFNSGNALWITLKNAIEHFASIDIGNDSALGAQTFDIFKPWISFYNVANVTHDEANKFFKEFLEMSINPEILKISQEKETSVNIPFANISEYGLTKLLNDPLNSNLFAYENNAFVNPIINQLAINNIKYIEFIKSNQATLINLIAWIGASAKYSFNAQNPNGIYYSTIENFYNNYLKTDSFFNVAKQINTILNVNILDLPLDVLGLHPTLLNPILRYIYPEVAISVLATQKETNGIVNGNLANLVLNKLVNFETLIDENTIAHKALVTYLNNKFANYNTTNIPLNIDNIVNLTMDQPYLEYLGSTNKVKIFGIDFLKMIPEIVNQIVEPSEMKDIVFNNKSSYLAKVNYAYLSHNNKAIFTGEIPNDPLEIQYLINNLNDKYLIDINGVKYIIIGQETTVDYMYPVIDENNLQVDTSNQALVYVNKFGFNRIRLAYQGNVVKKSLLVKNSTNLTNTALKEQIIEILNSSILDSGQLQRVFLLTEVDPVNPERSLRIKTVTGIIDAIGVSTIYLVSLFVILAAITTIFIIKRYISSKNKVFGILLSQGYKPAEIATGITVFSLVTSIIGGVLGYVIGNKLQYLVLTIFDSYWTVPKTTIPFDFITLIFTVFLPFIGMTALIYVVSIISLRKKPIDLITGIGNIKDTTLSKKYYKIAKKTNVKGRFASVLAFNSIWKLVSFGSSVILTGAATMFGVSSLNIFSKTIDHTYKNRSYTFKIDLESPTIEGGLYQTFNPQDLKNNIYTPLGSVAENNRELNDYLKPGYSTALNKDNLNGNPNEFDSHILTQFGVDVKVDAGVAASPWQTAYNSMPDSQKSRIDKIRDRVGYLLEKTQADNINTEWYIDPNTHYVSLLNKQTKEKLSFFKYYKSPYETEGKFKYAYWNGEDYEMVVISTSAYRNEYRDFLIKGYKILDDNLRDSNYQQPTYPYETEDTYWLVEKDYAKGKLNNDYFISFGGVYFDENTDEKFTYLNAQNNDNNTSFKIYGYQQDSRFIKLEDVDKKNLYDALYNYNIDKNVYPIVINNVVALKYNLEIGDKLNVNITNRVDRYLNTLKQLTGTPVTLENVQFEVVGINPTYINEELITRFDVANKLIGFNQLDNKNDSKDYFNGILTNAEIPKQVLESTSLYSISGYWNGYGSFDLSSISKEVQEAMFEEIYNPERGILSKWFNANKIMTILSNGASKEYNANLYNTYKNNAKEYIEEFAKKYDNKLYVSLLSTIDSKNIEASFTKQVGNTVEQITVAVIGIMFIISLVILVVLSTIMINENQRNIAIWGILGYTNKEKITMFFSIFIPFIIMSIIIAIPLVYLFIFAFKSVLLSATSIALPLTLSPLNIFITFICIFAIFIITSLITWIAINQMKPVDLLKGK